jgi:hypothetical protein
MKVLKMKWIDWVPYILVNRVQPEGMDQYDCGECVARYDYYLCLGLNFDCKLGYLVWIKCPKRTLAWMALKGLMYGIGIGIVLSLVIIALWVFTIMFFSLTAGVH